MSWVVLAQTVRISIPYVLASAGGAFSERGGVVNIALEGMLLNGAFAAALAAWATGSPAAGIAAACAAGALTALLHAFLCVTARADHIISGLAINLLAAGLTRFLLKAVFDSSANSAPIPAPASFELGIGGGAGILLDTIAGTPFVWISAASVVASWICLVHTPFGLRLLASGENPRAAEAAGVSVAGIRYSAVCAGGALAGLGGAYLAFHAGCFSAGMSNGRGYIALAALVFGRWHPLGAAAACLLFGFAEALQIGLQGLGSGPAVQLVQALPFMLTMVALAGVVGKSRPPSALGRTGEFV